MATTKRRRPAAPTAKAARRDTPLPRTLISVPEAAKSLGIGRTQAYALAQQGMLRSIKVGARRLVPVAALDEFVRARMAS